jgi:hypothetical protein
MFCIFVLGLILCGRNGQIKSGENTAENGFII